MIEYNPIAESNNFIILEKYSREWKVAEGYQSEGDLEREFISDLQNQGYEYRPELNSHQALLGNVRMQLQTLNKVKFSNGERSTRSRSALTSRWPLAESLILEHVREEALCP